MMNRFRIFLREWLVSEEEMEQQQVHINARIELLVNEKLEAIHVGVRRDVIQRIAVIKGAQTKVLNSMKEHEMFREQIFIEVEKNITNKLYAKVDKHIKDDQILMNGITKEVSSLRNSIAEMSNLESNIDAMIVRVRSSQAELDSILYFLKNSKEWKNSIPNIMCQKIQEIENRLNHTTGV